MLDCTIAYGLSFLFPAKDSAVGASLRDYGEFARPELDFLVEAAGGAGAFIDVGANIGAIALPFAAKRPEWRVLAVEAHRGVSGVLAANALNNRLHNVDVIHAAAGAERCLVDFPATSLSSVANFGNIGFHDRAAPMESVRMLTLDEIAPEDTRLIKIDVEGFEAEVLKGAEGLLRKRAVVWLAEATIQNPVASTTVIRTFQDAGYQVFWFYAPFVTPTAGKKRPTQPGVGDANVVALPPGAANSWGLTPIGSAEESRPPGIAAYPYLKRYGYG